jgi:deoxyuridine 5'-triphosphate nucleotidohydrolase
MYICDECLLCNKYTVIPDYFSSLNTIEKVYLFGLLINNIKSISYTNSNKDDIEYFDIRICDFKKSSHVFNALYKVCHNITYRDNIREIGGIIKSDIMVNDIKNNLNITKITSTNDIDFTYLLDNLKCLELKLAFICAYIEYNNIYSLDKNKIKLVISSYCEQNLVKIKEIINIPCEIRKNFNITYLIYYDVNIIDMLGIMFKNNENILKNKLYDLYIKILNNTYNLPLCKIYKTEENAVVPSKTRESDVGYDLTIIKEVKRFNKSTVLYDTGIKLLIQDGYYIEIVPRSSISKSGYMLSNSVGIIDQSYRGNIMVSLTKIDTDSPDIELPFKCCQLIIRKQYYVNMIEVGYSFDETDRNEGGYGSTSN